MSVDDHRIPLLIGVTGHRDIVPDDRADIEKRVRAFFALLRSDYPSTPLRVFCGLAAGADQLVAEVVLSFSGVELIPVLPMPEELYVGDFSADPDALERFRRLVSGRPPIVLDLLPGTTPEMIVSDPMRDGDAAKAQYAALGNFLSVRCQILLALWDGIESNQIGGAAYTVASKLRGRLDSDAALIDPIEGGLVYHIPTRRLNTMPSDLELADGFIAAGSTAPFLDALREIDYYNCAHYSGDDVEIAVDRAFRHADTLSLGFQRRVERSRIIVFSCLATLIISYATYSEFGHPQIALVAYFVALILGAYIWLVDRRQNLEQRFLDYRALAEALRIQLTWMQSGVSRSVGDYYLRKHRHDLRWIRFALRGFASHYAVIDLLARRRIQPARDLSIIKNEKPIRDWMEEQRSYFERGADVRERRQKLLQTFATVLYALGIGAALVALALPYVGSQENFGHAIFLLMGVLPALAGVLGAWIKQVAIAEEAARYRAMQSLFTLALAEWDRPESVTMHAAIVEDLGKEALQENADWLTLRRGLPIEPPLG